MALQATDFFLRPIKVRLGDVSVERREMILHKRAVAPKKGPAELTRRPYGISGIEEYSRTLGPIGGGGKVASRSPVADRSALWSRQGRQKRRFASIPHPNTRSTVLFGGMRGKVPFARLIELTKRSLRGEAGKGLTPGNLTNSFVCFVVK